MPKATIVSEIGDGEYVIQLEYDIARAVQLKERNELRIKELTITIAKLQGIVNTRTADKNTAANNLDIVIDTEAAATPAGQELSEISKGKINTANKALLDAIVALDEAEAPLRSDQLLLVQYQKDIDQIETTLSTYENPVPVEAWCADHTLKLEGEVGTLELSDETNSPQDQPTIIQPEGSIVDSKVVQPVISSGAMAIAYNLAAMPAFQKWQPVYRNGVISNINTIDNTADVSFNQTNEFSSVRGFKFNTVYSIFHDTNLVGIPVDYMDCHAEAFHENDKVVVKFASTGVNRAGEVEPEFTGTVIGFVSNPFLCPINIYLESGFLDLLSTGRCTEAAYLPATLHFDTETASYNGSLVRPMQLKTSLIPSDFTEDSPYFGITPTEGQDSLAVGCLPSEQLTEITDFCGNTHINGGYCNNVLGKKQVQQVIPASMWSGKLRLFVQSLYGSINSTYGKVNNFDLKVSYPEETDQDIYAPVTLVRGFQGSSILYTTENFDYFLFTYGGGQFTVFPLDLSQQGKNFRDHLLISSRLGDLEYVKRVEALMLSTAKINTGNSAVLPITGDPIFGSPLDYGWHSNWKGDEITCVTFFVDPLNPQYLSTVQKIKITETINPVTGGVSFAVINTPESVDSPWWPWTNGLNLLYYDENLQSMVPVELISGTIGITQGTFDSPVYTYYSIDVSTGVEELHTVNIYMDITDSPTDINMDISGDKRYSMATHPYTQKVWYSGSAGNKGFKVDSSIMDIPVFATTFRTDIECIFKGFHGADITSSLTWGTSGSSNTISDSPLLSSVGYMASLGLAPGDTKEVGGDTYHLKFMHYRLTWGTFQTQFPNGDSSQGSAFMQTLLGDCSNVVLCKSITEAHGGKLTSERFGFSKYFGGNLYWTDQPSKLVPPVTENIGDMPGPIFIFPLPTYSGLSDFENITFPAEPATTENDINEYKNGLTSAQTITDESVLSEYLQPTVSDPKTNTIDTSRESVGGKYKITHSSFSTDEGFIKDSSIGWS